MYQVKADNIIVSTDDVKPNLFFFSKTYDATGLYQTIVDLAHLNSDQLWSGQFKQTSPTMERETLKREIKEEVD